MQEFSGQWDTVSSPDQDEQALACDGPPYVRLRLIGPRLEGEFSLGPCRGQLDGRPDGDRRCLLSFEGMDGDDLVSGAATARIEDETLHLQLFFHFGPTQTFACRRSTVD